MNYVFARLPLLDEVVNRMELPVLRRTGFVCVQHLVETTGSLFESLLALGAEAGNVHVLGKCYSSCPDVVRVLREIGVNVYEGPLPDRHGFYYEKMDSAIATLWTAATQAFDRSKVDRIVLLDDGGQCIKHAPQSLAVPIVAIEQTTSGVAASLQSHIRVISVAGCAAKVILEPPMIARATASRVGSLIPSNQSDRLGVIGFGHIGQAVADLYGRSGSKVVVFDVKSFEELPKHVEWAPTAVDLFQECSIIFGCAGQDVAKGWIAMLDRVRGWKTLVSCSSGDVEFRSILRDSKEKPSFDGHGQIPPVHVTLSSELDVVIARGGFPANFDRSRESVRASDIQLTRGLLLAAILQANERALNGHGHGLEKLDAGVQKFIVGAWSAMQAVGANSVSHRFDDVQWVSRASEGAEANGAHALGSLSH